MVSIANPVLLNGRATEEPVAQQAEAPAPAPRKKPLRLKQREKVLIEEVSGIMAGEMRGRMGQSIKGTLALAWVLMRRERPEFDFEAILDMDDEQLAAILEPYDLELPNAQSPVVSEADS